MPDSQLLGYRTPVRSDSAYRILWYVPLLLAASEVPWLSELSNFIDPAHHPHGYAPWLAVVLGAIGLAPAFLGLIIGVYVFARARGPSRRARIYALLGTALCAACLVVALLSLFMR